MINTIDARVPRRATIAAGALLTLSWLLSPSCTAAPVSLAALVAEARTRNPEIRAARLQHAAALERRRPAAALEDPMLEVGIVNAPLPLSLRRDDMTMQMLGITQKLPFPGKRGLREAAAIADADVAGHAVDETVNRVSRDLALAYEDLRVAVRAIALAERTRGVLGQVVNVAQTRYALGRATQFEVLQAGTRLAQLQQDLLRLRTDRLTAESELRRLTGRIGESVSIEPMPAVDLPAPAEAADGDGNGNGNERPQMLGLRAMEARGTADLALAEREYFPDFELRLGYGHRERSLDGMPRDDMVTMTVAVNLPLWRKDRLEPRVAEARALRARAAEMSAEQALQTRAALEQQQARLEQARATIALYHSTLLPQTHAAAQAALSGYERGGSDLTMLLDATMREYDASLGEATALAAGQRAAAEIQFLTGSATTREPLPGAQP